MTQILIDGIANITLHSGVVRVECVTVGFDGKPCSSGTLIIPGASAGQILQTFVSGMQGLEKKLREQQTSAATKPTTN
jgi:hypothetical protein